METKAEDRGAECPVAALIPEAQNLIDAYEAADRARFAARHILKTDEVEQSKFRYDAQMKMASRYLDGVTERASFLRATSARGVLFQLCLIHSLTSDLEIYGDERGNRDASAAERAIDRMLYSIAEFIERETSERREDACGDFFMDREISPHEVLAAAMALRQPAKGKA